MTSWAVSIDAEADLQPPRFLASDDADIRSVQLSRGRVVGLRGSVRAPNGEAAVWRALAFYERRVGRPLGRVLEHRACVEGDLIAEDEGQGPGEASVPRGPLPVGPTTGEPVERGSSARKPLICQAGSHPLLSERAARLVDGLVPDVQGGCELAVGQWPVSVLERPDDPFG